MNCPLEGDAALHTSVLYFVNHVSVSPKSLMIYGLPHKQIFMIYSCLNKQQFIKHISRWLNSKGSKAALSSFVHVEIVTRTC